MAKEKTVKLNIRKYVNYILLMIIIVLLCFITGKLFKTFKSNILSESVLPNIVGSIQIDDIENTKKELTDEDFIFISYLNSQEVRNLEKGLKKTIIKNNLQNNFYYLDATSLINSNDYIDNINKKFKLKDNKIENLPALVYYKNGQVMKVLSSTKNKIISVDDFNKLLDAYEIIK